MVSQASDVLLNRLKNEQVTYAAEALRKPGMKTEFEFGQRCGYYAGLERAIELLLIVLNDERNGERDFDGGL